MVDAEMIGDGLGMSDSSNDFSMKPIVNALIESGGRICRAAAAMSPELMPPLENAEWYVADQASLDGLDQQMAQLFDEVCSFLAAKASSGSMRKRHRAAPFLSNG